MGKYDDDHTSTCMFDNKPNFYFICRPFFPPLRSELGQQHINKLYLVFWSLCLCLCCIVYTTCPICSPHNLIWRLSTNFRQTLKNQHMCSRNPFLCNNPKSTFMLKHNIISRHNQNNIYAPQTYSQYPMHVKSSFYATRATLTYLLN